LGEKKKGKLTGPGKGSRAKVSKGKKKKRKWSNGSLQTGFGQGGKRKKKKKKNRREAGWKQKTRRVLSQDREKGGKQFWKREGGGGIFIEKYNGNSKRKKQEETNVGAKMGGQKKNRQVLWWPVSGTRYGTSFVKAPEGTMTATQKTKKKKKSPVGIGGRVGDLPEKERGGTLFPSRGEKGEKSWELGKLGRRKLAKKRFS